MFPEVWNLVLIKQLKKDMVTEIAATLAFSAIQNNDKIGVIFFSDRIEKFIPPKKGRKHILYIIRELIDFQAGKPSHKYSSCLGIFDKRNEKALHRIYLIRLY